MVVAHAINHSKFVARAIDHFTATSKSTACPYACMGGAWEEGEELYRENILLTNLKNIIHHIKSLKGVQIC